MGMIEIHENLFRFLEFHGYLPSGYSNYSIIDHLFGISIQHIPMDKGLTESIILTRIGIPWSFVHWYVLNVDPSTLRLEMSPERGRRKANS